jgi:hypothetical protein|tara:strand:+ start:1567 stop:1854 length:288 start_codon:yes stop_codon:yes gene_type:complete
MATKAEKKHMDKVAQLGCFVCERPATLHHIRPKGTGIGRRTSHFEVIPLCPDHHQGKFSIHMSKKAFEEKYGTEKEILEIVLQRVKEEECRSSIL